MTKLRAWRAAHFCRPLAIADEIGLCLRPDLKDGGLRTVSTGSSSLAGNRAGLPSASSHRI